MAHTTTVYGIPNCDSVKKARTWLNDQGLDHEFHDFKKLGVPPSRLQAWISRCGWETVLNRKGTTWRGLPVATQSAVADAHSARSLMLTHPSLVKRPVVVAGTHVIVGVNPDAWSSVI